MDSICSQFLPPQIKASYHQTCLLQIGNRKVRAIFDSGAARSLILKSLVDELRLLQVAKQHLTLYGFGSMESLVSNSVVQAQLSSLDRAFQLDTFLSVVDSLQLRSVGALPPSTQQWLHKYKHIAHADISRSEIHAQPIEIVLGLEYYGKLWRGMEMQVDADLTARESWFGWIVYGVRTAEDQENPQENPDIEEIKLTPEQELDVLQRELEINLSI